MAKTAYRAVKDLAREICPPFVWRVLQRAKATVAPFQQRFEGHPGHQDLEMYWNEDMAQVLETWGDGNVWNEIQYLLWERSGRVLDIACGTGKTMQVLSKFRALDIHGIDISDFLIKKAVERGIAKERLKVGDATKLDYRDAAFAYSYSIGSLEHFTEDGLAGAVRECARVTSRMAFHMVPTSRSGRDEGWMKTHQSFFNNSVEWWVAKYRIGFPVVYVLDSAWNDIYSVGKWFVCSKETG